MNTKKITVAIAALALAMYIPGQSVMAGFSDGCSVTMGGNPVFKITSGAEGFTPEHRAWLAQDALDNALVLSDNCSPSAVNVERQNGAWVVTLGGRLVATADGGSAEMEGLSAEALAHKWADSIKDFLADGDRTNNYVATLIGKKPVEASVAVLERRLYAPAGLAFTARFAKDLTAADLEAGEIVEARLDKDVPVGHYVIPSESVVIGEVTQNDANDYVILFNTLRTPSGTEVPIKAYVATNYEVSTGAPHRVCTYAIPAGSANGMPGIVARVPAGVGIGAIDSSRTSTLVLHKGVDVIAAEKPVTLIFESTTPVAVITRDTAM